MRKRDYMGQPKVARTESKQERRIRRRTERMTDSKIGASLSELYDNRRAAKNNK